MTDIRPEVWEDYLDFAAATKKFCEHYMRVIAWRAKLAHKFRPVYCGMCKFTPVCERLRANDRILGTVLSGRECPDFQSFWEELFK